MWTHFEVFQCFPRESLNQPEPGHWKTLASLSYKAFEKASSGRRDLFRCSLGELSPWDTLSP